MVDRGWSKARRKEPPLPLEAADDADTCTEADRRPSQDTFGAGDAARSKAVEALTAGSEVAFSGDRTAGRILSLSSKADVSLWVSYS